MTPGSPPSHAPRPAPLTPGAARSVGRSTGQRLGLALLLFLLALLPRLIGLGEAVTEDEDQWIGRSGNFARALVRADWRETFQIGHPGVTTMWVTSLALGLEDTRRFASAERAERLVTQAPGFLEALHRARLPFAALNALLVTLCTLLAWRLFGPGAGLLAGLLMALEPYWLAMSPIVGMDGLLAGLLGLSLLSAILAFDPPGAPPSPAGRVGADPESASSLGGEARPERPERPHSQRSKAPPSELPLPVGEGRGEGMSREPSGYEPSPCGSRSEVDRRSGPESLPEGRGSLGSSAPAGSAHPYPRPAGAERALSPGACAAAGEAALLRAVWTSANRYALGSGLAAGLALLTKGPALLLLPLLPLMAFEAVWRARRRRAALGASLVRLTLWGLGFVGAALIWPALWADPLATFNQTAEFIRETGATPHGPGNFFLGRAVADPGPLFYPVALALRLGPATTVGLVGLLAVSLASRLGRSRIGKARAGGRKPAVDGGLNQAAQAQSGGREPAGDGGRGAAGPAATGGRGASLRGEAAGLLTTFVLLFLLGLTLSPKKVDRYLLPLFPALAILAGLGWWSVLRVVVDWRARRPGGPIRFGPAWPATVLVAMLTALQLWALAGAPWHPLAAYNPLVGGMPVAQRTIPVGWGEGLDQVGAYLAGQPNADSLVTAIWYPLYVNFQAHAPGEVVNITFSGSGQVGNRQQYDRADYFVDYIHARQRRRTPRALAERQPDFVVAINGADYARVYRLEP